MKPEKQMSYEEAQKIENTINSLIGRHNVLCRIEEAFCENDIANEYFENARNEVLDSGNSSLASMFSIAINNMASDIELLRKNDDNDYIYEIESKIRKLESENRKLITRIDNIKKAALNIRLED